MPKFRFYKLPVPPSYIYLNTVQAVNSSQVYIFIHTHTYTQSEEMKQLKCSSLINIFLK